MGRMDLLNEAKKIKQDIVRLRRDVHMHPELGNEEFRTVGIVEDTLRSLDIETKRIAGTGLVGLLKGKGPGKTVALRADMDALPITEENKVEYASIVTGKMHACGHDVHTAGLLGAAMLLSKCRNQFSGNVKFLFQPAEETSGGALPMINEGALENPKVDAVFGLHCNIDYDAGKVGVMYGKTNASSDMFEIEIVGKGSHGAYPHRGIDAIAIGAQVVSALQTIVSRNVDPVDSAVVTVGKFIGGYQRNVIADNVKLSGIIRALDPATREATANRLKDIVYNICTAMGANVTIELVPSYPSLINHDEMVDLVKTTAEQLIGEKNIIEKKLPSLGVEDFAYFAQKVPGAFFYLGVRNEAIGIIHQGHSSLFDIDEDALPLAAALHTAIVLRYLAG